MNFEAPRGESSKAEHEALEDFARLAALVTGASSARLEIEGQSASWGEPRTGPPTEIVIGKHGRLLLFEPSQGRDGADLIARRVAAHFDGRRAALDEAHTAALAIAERANDIARSAARRFETLFEGLPVACYSCDAQGHLREWNRAAEEIWGDALAMGLGEDVATIVDPEHPEVERAVLARALSGERVRSEEREVRVGEGDVRWHLVSAFPLRDGEERIVGALGARQDVTRRRAAQRELAEREARFRTVFVALHEGLMVVDEAGRMILLNPSGARILRLDAESADLAAEFPLGSAIDADGEVVPAESWPLVVALRTGKSARDVLLGVARPGLDERVWICLNAEPLWGPGGEGPTGAVATFNDVTAQVRQGREIAEYAARLAAYGET